MRFVFELAPSSKGRGGDPDGADRPDAVVRFVTSGGGSGQGSGGGPGTEDDGTRARWERAGFLAKGDQVLVVPPMTDHEPVIYVVGVASPPPHRSGPWTPTELRRAAAVVGRALRPHDVVHVELDAALVAGPTERAAAAEAVAEGMTLGGHAFVTYKGGPARSDRAAGPASRGADGEAAEGEGSSGGEGPATGGTGSDAARARTTVRLLGGGGRRVATALEHGADAARAIALVRDLSNTPGGDLTPEAFAAEAERQGAAHGFGVEVLDLGALRDQGYAGVVGVNQGSARPARFVTLRYSPASGRPRGHLALVGKGVTFDSGGLSIKTMAGMMGMKGDMAGAAAVLGAFTRFASAGVRAEVTGYLPLTDNMTGPDAIRPGDVLRYRNGTTVEVLNTDAEGRLVLADALIDASRAEPDAIIDLATLTGAITTALGGRVAGLMGNNEAWLQQVEAAADAAGERLWRLPLPLDERPRLDSDVADLRNIGKGVGAGSLVAGVFLQEFVAAGIPWAHLDIAASAWSEEIRGESVRGATGYGVRTLVALARSFSRPATGLAANA